MKKVIKHVLGLLCLSMSLSVMADYPDRPIELVVAFGAGGTSDIMGRTIATSLEKILKQPIVVVNKPGAGGTIGVSYAANAKPDGYTLVVSSVSGMAVAPACVQNMPYDSLKDFTQVSTFSQVPNIVTVHESFPANDFRGFIKELKKNPDKYNYGAQYCTHLQMIAEQIKISSGVEFNFIPYKTGPQVVMDTLNNQVQILFETVPTSWQHIQSGRLRPMAVAWRTRLPELPNVPTLLELGLEDANITAWYGIAVPSGTPPEIVKKLNLAIKEAVKDPEFLEKMKSQQAMPDYSTPEEMKKTLQREVAKHKRAIATGRIRTN